MPPNAAILSHKKPKFVQRIQGHQNSFFETRQSTRPLLGSAQRGATRRLALGLVARVIWGGNSLGHHQLRAAGAALAHLEFVHESAHQKNAAAGGFQKIFVEEWITSFSGPRSKVRWTFLARWQPLP